MTPGREPPPAGAEPPGYGRDFLPGPTEVHPEVLGAMYRPVIGHRGEEMKDLLAGLQGGLRELFGTERPVFVSTSSATGLMEAAITNLTRRRALCLVAGAFGRRFHEIAEAVGRPADVLEVEWGAPNTPERLAAELAEAPGRYDLVTVVHSETSTGVLNPVGELAEVVHDFEDVLLAVDGVSSVAGAPVEVDAWGVDYMLTGSQKALAVPPGLALGTASERALERAREAGPRGHYFDLLDFDRRIREDQTPNTPAVSLLYALERQLGRIAEEGLAARLERHAEMASRVHAWVAETAGGTGEPLEVLAPPGYRSPTVTAIRLPGGVSGREVAARVRDRGWIVAPGYGKLKEETVRIGHMGDHTPRELEALLEVLGDVLRD